MKQVLRALSYGLIAATGLVLALSAAVQGQESVVHLVPTTSNVVESRYTVGVAKFSAEVRLRNTSTDSASGLRMLSTSDLFVRQGDGHSETAAWERQRGGANPARLRPGEEATFQLSGNLPNPGVYETWIEAAPAQGDDPASVQRIRIVVTRMADALPGDFIAEFRPVGEDLGVKPSLFWPLGVRADSSKVLLSMRNATTLPVEFGAPIVVSYSEQSGDVVTAVATSTPPHIDAGDCLSPLLPGKSCATTLILPGDAWAGQYLVDIGVGGTGGGWSERTQIVNVRASWFLAFLTVAAGVIGGAFINFWRARGRQSLSGLIDVARLREPLSRLRPDPGDPDTERLVARTLAYADGIEAAIRRGGDPAPDLTRLSENVTHLSAMAEIGRGLGGLSPAGREALRTGWEALVGRVAIDAPADAKKELDKALSTLAADVRDWPRLESVSNSAHALADAISGMQTASAGRADASKAAELVESLTRATELARRSKTPEPVHKRVEALEAAIRDTRSNATEYFNDAATKLQTAAQALLAKAAAGSTEFARTEELFRKVAASVAAPPPADTVETRLGELAAQWKTYGELDLIISGPSAGGRAGGLAAPAFAVSGVPGLDVPITLLLPSRGASLARLERAQSRNEWLTNGLIVLATSLAGLVALWAQDPNWGSTTDIIAAFLAGAAVNVAIGPAAGNVPS